MALAVKHNFSNLVIKRVERVPQPLLKFVIDEVGLVSPAFETLSNKVVRETFELFVRCLHLVVLCVEEHRLLDLVNITLVQNVDANAELLDLEIGLQRVTDGVSARLIDVAIEDLEHFKCLMSLDKLGDSQRADFTQARVAELEDP